MFDGRYDPTAPAAVTSGEVLEYSYKYNTRAYNWSRYPVIKAVVVAEVDWVCGAAANEVVGDPRGSWFPEGVPTLYI